MLETEKEDTREGERIKKEMRLNSSKLFDPLLATACQKKPLCTCHWKYNEKSIHYTDAITGKKNSLTYLIDKTSICYIKAESERKKKTPK